MTLRAKNDFAYTALQPHKMQGALYHLLRGTPYGDLHDRPGYKFFCFSNLFAPNREGKKRVWQPVVRAGEERRWLVSSPLPGFVNLLREGFEKMRREGEALHIGDAALAIEETKTFSLRLSEPCTLITATPIVVRVPQYAYAGYGVKSALPYLYWRAGMDPKAFVKQLRDNLAKKHGAIFGSGKAYGPLFQTIDIKKSVVTEITIDGRTVPVAGTVCSFYFENLAKKEKELLAFGVEAGFGERNTLGYGFMNQVNTACSKP